MGRIQLSGRDAKNGDINVQVPTRADDDAVLVTVSSFLLVHLETIAICWLYIARPTGCHSKNKYGPSVFRRQILGI